MGGHCETCRFWQLVNYTEHSFGDGRCQRHAPKMVGEIAPHGNAVLQDIEQAIWPKTLPRDWCGEYARLSPSEGHGGGR